MEKYSRGTKAVDVRLKELNLIRKPIKSDVEVVEPITKKKKGKDTPADKEKKKKKSVDTRTSRVKEKKKFKDESPRIIEAEEKYFEAVHKVRH